MQRRGPAGCARHVSGARRPSDERRATADGGSTIADALFRDPHKGEYGMDLTESEAEAAAVEPRLERIVKEIDKEEDTFCAASSQADGRTPHHPRGVGGTDWCRATGNLEYAEPELSPSEKTIMKLATALNVSPTVLWPGVEVQQILDAMDRVQEDQVMSAAEAEALQAALQRPPSRIEVTRLPLRNRR